MGGCLCVFLTVSTIKAPKKTTAGIISMSLPSRVLRFVMALSIFHQRNRLAVGFAVGLLSPFGAAMGLALTWGWRSGPQSGFLIVGSQEHMQYRGELLVYATVIKVHDLSGF